MNQPRERSRTPSRRAVTAATGGAPVRTGLLFGLGALQFAVGSAGLAGQEAEDCGAGVPLGVAVVDESGSISIPFATVRLASEDEGALDGLLQGQAGSDGRLVFCVPSGVNHATLSAEFGDASSDETEVNVRLAASQDVVLRLRVASAENGRLLGTVTDALSDAPVIAAAVSLGGRAQAVQTNRQGGFILSDVPVGVHELSVRHLGYAPLRHMVSVTRGATTDIQIGLVPAPLEMEPLVATAVRLRRLEIKGFYERKRWGEQLGLGSFFTLADIERRKPRLISDMIMQEASIRRVCGMGSRSCRLYTTRMATGFGSRCLMQVYLDGILISEDGEADMWPTVDIAGVEVYKGAASLPAEFTGPNSRCGVVAIWTK